MKPAVRAAVPPYMVRENLVQWECARDGPSYKTYRDSREGWLVYGLLMADLILTNGLAREVLA